MSMNNVDSVIACPINTEGPAFQPTLKDVTIVANIMGPGTRAADIPTVNPRIRAFINSIMNITTGESGYSK
ncbi:hypothetical protein MSMTP_2571 [Methanosarcina sp. MTP4]|nr:hypothetical protein MSMTP_2571 [Methanosarcina sp. MTP4]